MRWLEKEEYKAKMECINLLKYNKLNISNSDRKYCLMQILNDKDNENCCDYIGHKQWLINNYGLKAE